MLWFRSVLEYYSIESIPVFNQLYAYFLTYFLFFLHIIESPSCH